MKSNFTYKVIRGMGMPILDKKFHPRGVHTERIPYNEPLIICPNHYHYCDQYMIEIVMHEAWKLNKKGHENRVIRWFAKNEYSKGMKSLFYKGAGCIFVKRGEADSRACLEEGEEVLARGDSVGIFPEGTRNTYFPAYFTLQEKQAQLDSFMKNAIYCKKNVYEASRLHEEIRALKTSLAKMEEDLQKAPKNAIIHEGEAILGYRRGAASMAKHLGVRMLPVAVTGDYVEGTDNILVNFGEPVGTISGSVEEVTEETRGKVLELVNENRKNSSWLWRKK